MALCKLNAMFSVSNITMLDTEKKRRDFCARRSDAPEAHSCALRTRREAATKHSAKRPSFFGEFDPGSGRTLAACLTHASRTGTFISVKERVANG